MAKRNFLGKTLIIVSVAIFSSACNLESTDSQPVTGSTELPADCTIPTSWVAYTVVRGDTLYDIALLHQSTVDELTAANCLTDPHHLDIGQVIYVPSGTGSGDGSLSMYVFAPNTFGADGHVASCGGAILMTTDRSSTGTITGDIRAMLELMLGSYIQDPLHTGQAYVNPLYSQHWTVNNVALIVDTIRIELDGQLQLVEPCFDDQLEAQLVLTAFHFPQVNSAQISIGGQTAKQLFDTTGLVSPEAVYTRADVPGYTRPP